MRAHLGDYEKQEEQLRRLHTQEVDGRSQHRSRQLRFHCNVIQSQNNGVTTQSPPDPLPKDSDERFSGLLMNS
jgi:hypothetical protein